MAGSFTSTYKVTIGDINYGGHLGNDRALVIFQDARLVFLKSFGASEKDIGGGCGIIMVESGVRYIREVFLHDELHVAMTVTELRGKKFSLGYTVSRLSDGKKVLSGFTSFLSFDYHERSVAAIPGAFQEKVAAYLDSER